MLQIKSVSMAVIESSFKAASNSFLEQTEWAQRCLLETSLAGFGETLPDRGDRVSRPTTRAAIGLMLRGGCGFFWDQSRWWRAAVAFASGEREGASMACDQWLPVLYDRFVAGGRCVCFINPYKLLFRPRLRGMPSVLQDASFAPPVLSSGSLLTFHTLEEGGGVPPAIPNLNT